MTGEVLLRIATGFRPERSFWKGKRVLVTGHTGFKGSWLTMWLTDLGAVVGGLALQPDTRPSMFEALRLKEMCDHSLGDIRDADVVGSALKRFRPQIVIHMAAQPLVRLSYQRPVETFAVNVLGTAHLLQASRGMEDLRSILIVTTDKCYENREWPYGYRETDRLGGHDPYSASKACAELVTSAFRRSFFESQAESAAVATARSGNVVGGGDWSQDRLVPDAVRAFVQGQPVKIRNPKAVRPWQHVLEPLEGYLRLARAGYEKGAEYAGAWNFGPRPVQVLSVGDVIEAFARKWGHGADCHYEPAKATLHEAGLLLLDSTLAERRLGWSPLLSFDGVLETTANWYRTFYAGASAEELRQLTLGQIESVIGRGGNES